MKPFSPPPGYIAPLLPTLVTAPPLSERWLHEIKHDGYRTLIAIDGGRARAFTRNGHDWTDRYRPVAAAAEKLACRSAVIDGEMLVQDELGRSDFAGLRSAIAREPHRLVFFAFDLLHLDGRGLRSAPLTERRGALRDLLAPVVSPMCPLQFSDDFDGDGADLFAAADRLGLEGNRFEAGRQPLYERPLAGLAEMQVHDGLGVDPGWDRGRCRQCALCSQGRKGTGFRSRARRSSRCVR